MRTGKGEYVDYDDYTTTTKKMKKGAIIKEASILRLIIYIKSSNQLRIVPARRERGSLDRKLIGAECAMHVQRAINQRTAEYS